LYATDASAYREVPLGVVFPESVEEIQFLVNLASDEEFSLIPRTAGTSLAGQVVGPGLIVDVSKHLNQILEVNVEASWVRVQPGVIRDDLNRYLRPFGLYFGPETSTANRAMLGGMVGNNSCGSNSVVYGSTRDHLLEAEVVLSDGSMARFGPSDMLFEASKGGSNLQNRLYSETLNWLSDPEIAMEIHHESPKKSIHRRNTGYAVDLLLDQKPFSDSGQAFNFCSLLAGSEGTLCFFTELKLQLVKLPPKHAGLLCIHCESIDEALRANLIALEFQISASELIDHYILECTKTNRDQEKNRFFVKGDPKAILVVEIARDNFSEMEEEVQRLISRLTDTGLGYHFPLISGEDVSKVWALRKAGLGLLSNMPGDPKPVAVIEDTAVDVLDLPAFIKEFNIILSKRNLYCVHYAHAGSGELHLRPIIDLKTREGTELFRTIATDIARLVKKYKGSLSGEHGDGRLRGEFIPVMVGERNYQLFRKIKALWDPKGIFNPGKIVDTPPMDSSLRYTPGQSDRYQQTYFDFGPVTMQQHAEQCNGSGDCRKPAAAGGTMCPSFMATRNEKETTRARANVLREMMTNGGKDALGRPEIKAVMDLCLSCKGCKSECPSNVDVGKLKAEFLQHYYLHHGIPLRTRLIGHFSAFSAIGSLFPTFYNGLLEGNFPGNLFKRILGFAPQRNLPVLGRQTVRAWFKSKGMHAQPERPKGEVVLFLDEFSNFNDVQLGKKAIRLLQALGYKVNVIHHPESGRAFLSKGMLKEAMELARKNVALFAPLVGPDCPLIGIEPSALLSFVDEYPDLLRGDMQVLAKNLSENCLLLEEFLVREWEAGRVKKSSFCADERKIRLHGHCHQKALGRLAASKKALSIPDNYSVLLIPSGCCGMAGSFGYEAEHYELSMQVGELVLFPTIRSLDNNVIIAAPGTSCRHQISDGTKKEAFHPIEVLFNALAEVPEV
jgi:FAD/FMN-containing dehydrogenase/Fe-S oxidoreductase